MNHDIVYDIIDQAYDIIVQYNAHDINNMHYDINYDTMVLNYDIIYDLTYDIKGQYSICSTAALRRPRCGSGLATTLPGLCSPCPALAESLGPDLLRLGDRHHPGAAPAVAPHPDVHLVEPGSACCCCPGPAVCRPRLVQYADRPRSGMG